MAEINLTNDNFAAEVLESDKPVLVDFWAPWCGPCRMLGPVISEIAEQYSDKVKVCKVNVDEQNELAVKYGISSIPTLKLFKNGEVADSSIGLVSKAKIEEMIG